MEVTRNRFASLPVKVLAD